MAGRSMLAALDQALAAGRATSGFAALAAAGQRSADQAGAAAEAMRAQVEALAILERVTRG